MLINEIIAGPADRLGGGPAQRPAAQREPEREEEGQVPRHRDGRETHRAGIQHDIGHRAERRVPLVMVDKDEAGGSVRPQTAAQCLPVLRRRMGEGTDIFHAGQFAAEVGGQQMEQVEPPVLGAGFAVLAQRRGKIIVEDRVVVGVAGGAGFLQGGVPADGVGAAVVHIISDQVVAASQLDEREGVGVHAGDPHPAVVGGLLARADLAGSEGVTVIGQLPAVRRGGVQQVGAHRRVVAGGVEQILRREGQRIAVLGPGGVGIGRKDRQHLRRRDARPADRVPARDSVERHLEPFLHRDPFERREMVAVVHQLVFQLDADNRPAVAVEQAADLPVDAAVPCPDQRQIGRVVLPQRDALVQQPVGESAVAAFAVGPGADAQHHIQPGPAAAQHEPAHVQPAGEPQLPFPLLVVNPEQIGGDHRDAARLHLAELGLPLCGVAAGKMELAHDGQPGLSAPGQAETVDFDPLPAGVAPAQMQVSVQDFGSVIGFKFNVHHNSPCRDLTGAIPGSAGAAPPA